MWETQVQSLGWEDHLEKEMAIHSSTIAWKIPWTEEPGRLQPMGSQRVGHDWATSLSLSLWTKLAKVKEYKLSFIKSENMMLLMRFIQKASKSGKLSSDHRTGKFQFSFQSQRRPMSNNVHTTIQFRSFSMLLRLYTKSFRLGFSSTWTENFQMYKPGLEKTEEPEIKLPTFMGSWRKHQNSRKTSTSVSLTMLFDCADHNKLCKILKEMGVPDPLTCLLRNLGVVQEATVRTKHGTIGSKLGEEYVNVVYHQSAYLTYMQHISHEMPAEYITSWIQDCWEKYQQAQLCSWYHSNGIK